MIYAFKNRENAQALCNAANRIPGVRLMVLAVPAGWIITKAKGVNTHA